MEFQSVNKQLELSFREHWERDALSDYQGSTLRYCDVARSIKIIQIGFERYGLKKGDKVAICARNQAHWGVCFLAALTYGAVPVPILHEFKPENVSYLVNHSEAKVFFVDESIWEGISEASMPEVQAVVGVADFEFIYVRKGGTEHSREEVIDDFNRAYPDDFSPEDVIYHEDLAEDLALINYTSGTSGFSKGVMLPYRAIYANMYAAKYVAEPQMDCNSEIVAMLPSAHMYGLMFEFLYEMTIGAHVHFLTRVPSPKIILKAFSEIRPDLIIAVPLIIEKVFKSHIKPALQDNRNMLKVPILDQIVLKKIRSSLLEAFGGRFEEIIVGGAAFNPEVEQFMRKIHFPLTVGYGMTECAPLVTYCKWNETRKGSCGKPIPGCQIRIDSRNPRKEPGEIQIKGDNLFMGYYKNRDATRKCMTNDNWFKTGDLGVMDSDGFLYLRGRSKCMILGPSGQNIYPEELEAIINNFPHVVDSLVIEDNGGLTALIYPDYALAGREGLDRKDLEQRLLDSLPEINKMLPGYAQIRRLEFMPEDFERTPKRSIKRYLYQRN